MSESVNEEVEKNCSFWWLATGDRQGTGQRVGRFLIREESNFFLESDQEREERENFFPLPSNFWTLIKKEERVKMAASVSWSQRWLRPEVSDSKSSSFFETTTDDTC